MDFLKKYWLWIFYIYLMWHLAYAGNIHQFLSNKNIVLDNETKDIHELMGDYEDDAEDIAKESIRLEIRDALRPHIIESSYSKMQSDVINVCKISTEAFGKFFECRKEDFPFFVCMESVDGKIVPCRSGVRTASPIPLCVNKETRILVTCDKPFFHICQKNETKSNQLTATTCFSSEKKLCLEKNPGFIEPCVITKVSNISSNLIESLSEFHEKASSNWWKEWRPKSTTNKTVKDFETVEVLCITEDKTLRKCSVEQDTSENSVACVATTNGEIHVCSELANTHFQVPICLEANSKKVITCGKPTTAFLCFTGANEKNLLVPCGIKSRHICLEDNGLLVTCSSKPNHSEYIDLSRLGTEQDVFYKPYQNITGWLVWWKEYLSHGGLVKKVVNETGDYLCRPKNVLYDLMECNKVKSKENACISALTGNVGQCTEFKRTEMAVPICLEKHSRKIITCGNVTSAYICRPEQSKASVVKPCLDTIRQICLSDQGKFTTCSVVSKREISSIFPPIYPGDDPPNMSNTGHQSPDDISLLCVIEKNGFRFERCPSDLSLPTACLNSFDGKLKSCEGIETDFQIGIAICVEEKTNRLMTCEEDLFLHLCYQNEDSLVFEPCNSMSTAACIDEKGQLKACHNSSTEYSETQETDFVTEYTTTEFSYYTGDNGNSTEYSNQSSEDFQELCITEDTNQLIECDLDDDDNGDPELQEQACLNIKEGVFVHCSEDNTHKLIIPVCRKITTKQITTCGLLNKDNLCFSDLQTKSYQPCNNEQRFACFDNENVQRCFGYVQSEMKRKRPRSVEEQSDFENKERVYVAEKRSIRKIMRNSVNLCKDSGKIKKCEKVEEIDLLCFGARTGNVESCSKFSKTELVIPLCAQKKDGKVHTCGKFFSGRICYLNDTALEPCNSTAREICFTQWGGLVKCEGKDTEIEDYFDSEESENSKLEDEKNDESDELEDSVYGPRKKGHSKRKMKQEDHIPEDKILDYLFDYYEDETDNSKKEDTDKEKKKQERLDNKQEKKTRYSSSDRKNIEKMVKDIVEYYADEVTEDESKSKTATGNNKKSTARNSSDRKIDKIVQDLVDYYVDELNEDDSKSITATGTNKKVTQKGKSARGSQGEAENHRFLRSLTKKGYRDEADKRYKKRGSNSRSGIKKEIFEMITKIHKKNKHLCKASRDNDELIDCDDVWRLKFACIGSKSGQIKSCTEFREPDVAFPLCVQDRTKYLVTCDIVSNVNLCLKDKSSRKSLQPCQDSKEYACFKDGTPGYCQDSDTQIQNPKSPGSTGSSSTMATYLPDSGADSPGPSTGPPDSESNSSGSSDKSVGFATGPPIPGSTDEKFFRFHCSNCTIENKLVVVGTPDSVLPETEVFTFPSR